MGDETFTLDEDAIRSWLALAYADCDGNLHISSNLDWSGRFFPANGGVDDLIGYVRELDRREAQGIYLRATTIWPITEGRGKRTDAVEIIGMHSDIDIAGPGHKHDPEKYDGRSLPANQAQALAIIGAAGLPRPTLVTHSGGGLYAWWLLPAPVVIEDHADVGAMSQGWQDALERGARSLGLHYGSGVGDLARVLRLPGTVNRKTAEGRPCRVLDSSGPRYGMGALRSALTSSMPAPAPATPPPSDSDPFDVPSGFGPGEGISALDDFERRHTWRQILEPKGWTHHHGPDPDGTDYWERPGGSSTGGHSATTGHAGDRDRMYCFSTEAGLDVETPMTKGYVFAKLYHDGDLKRAVDHLANLGYGTRGKDEAPPDSAAILDAVAALRSELLTPSQLIAMPPPKPLINGVCDLDTIVWLIGKAGSYKSFVALDMAAHVAAGRDWHGHRVTQGNVIYIVAEGKKGMTLRVSGWQSLHGVMGDSLQFLPRPVQVKDPQGWAVLVELCRQDKPSLVIIDTQSRVTIGLQENDNSEMMIYVNAADQIRRATGACVLTVHHQGRNGLDARGASSIDGSQDAELRIERPDEEARSVIIHMDKQKDQDDSATIELDLALVNDHMVDPETGRKLSSLAVVGKGIVPKPPKLKEWIENAAEWQAAIVEVLWDHFRYAGATKAEAKAMVAQRRGKTRTEINSGFNTAWDALIEKEKILKIKGSSNYILESAYVNADPPS